MNHEEKMRLARQTMALLCQFEIDKLKECEDAAQESSKKSKKKYIERDREGGFKQLYNDYFSDRPTYSDFMFRRRFRMRRVVFLKIVNAVSVADQYFQQRPDATGREGLHPLQKCTMALRQLAYGGAPDMFDEYLRIADSTGRLILEKFCRALIAAFGDEYLRRPTQMDCARLIQMHEVKHGFPGMLGSVDCMHWPWKNCPTAWAGAYLNYKKACPTLILEAVASTDLWIWHAFFGVAGSNNDINVLNQSPLFNDVLNGVAPAVSFMANNNLYRMGYYLADGIYPRWPTFVKTLPCPTTDQRRHFALKQEAARKDIERAFGVLQQRWGIIRAPARPHYLENITEIMYACVIMHNMIVEDEGPDVENWSGEEEAGSSSSGGGVQARQGVDPSFAGHIHRNVNTRDARAHDKLQDDMIEEMWARNTNRDARAHF